MAANIIAYAGGRQTVWRIGVVSFLNSRPLICDLQEHDAVRLCFDAPSALTDRLLAGEFDAALIPVIDLLRSDVDLEIVSDACIASNGETLTVRVFSKIPPEQIRCIHLDRDSHTSAALVKLLWPELFSCKVQYKALSRERPVEEYDSVLLIGDKVVGVNPTVFRYQVDLGGAWRTWTGLPFVFAVWAAPAGGVYGELAQLLCAARDRGVKHATRLAVEFGPALGWPTALAQQYLQRYLTFSMTDKHVEGMVQFLDLARRHQHLPATVPAPTVARP